MPPIAITSTAASGASRQTQAATIMRSAPEGLQPVDVEGQAPPRHRDDQAEADDDLGSRDGHYGDREHLARALAAVSRERDQGEVAAVEHDLEREQDDERRAAKQYAERADREEHGAHGEIPGDVRTEHSPAARACANGGRG